MLWGFLLYGNILNMKNMKDLAINEMKEINGGGFPWVPFIMLGVYLYDHRDRFMEGIKDGMR